MIITNCNSATNLRKNSQPDHQSEELKWKKSRIWRRNPLTRPSYWLVPVVHGSASETCISRCSQSTCTCEGIPRSSRFATGPRWIMAGSTGASKRHSTPVSSLLYLCVNRFLFTSKLLLALFHVLARADIGHWDKRVFRLAAVFGYTILSLLFVSEIHELFPLVSRMSCNQDPCNPVCTLCWLCWR